MFVFVCNLNAHVHVLPVMADCTKTTMGNAVKLVKNLLRCYANVKLLGGNLCGEEEKKLFSFRNSPVSYTFNSNVLL